MQSRLAHLHVSKQTTLDDKAAAVRSDRVLIDYMLRCGAYEAAAQLASEAKVEDLVDVELFMASRRVVDALRQRDCSVALAWCSENKARLRKTKV